MSTVIATPVRRPARPRLTGPRGGRRLIGSIAVVAIAAAGIVSVRVALDQRSRAVATATPIRVASRAVSIPHNPRIEAAWGIKFTHIVMLADNGLLEVRYQVVDSSKSGRLHSGGEVQNLPTLVDETRGTKVLPHSLMLHFHHVQTATVGATYSILYGNSGGAIHVGDKVTLRMVDGLTLPHVIVST